MNPSCETKISQLLSKAQKLKIKKKKHGRNYSVVLIWIHMEGICTKCNGDEEKKHLWHQEEVREGDTEKTAFVLRPKG